MKFDTIAERRIKVGCVMGGWVLWSDARGVRRAFISQVVACDCGGRGSCTGVFRIDY